MQCHLHLGSAIQKLCTKQQKQRSTYVIFSNNYVFYLPLRQLEPGKKYKYVSASPGTNKTNGFPIALVTEVSCSFSLEIDVQLWKATEVMTLRI